MAPSGVLASRGIRKWRTTRWSSGGTGSRWSIEHGSRRRLLHLLGRPRRRLKRWTTRHSKAEPQQVLTTDATTGNEDDEEDEDSDDEDDETKEQRQKS